MYSIKRRGVYQIFSVSDAAFILKSLFLQKITDNSYCKSFVNIM